MAAAAAARPSPGSAGAEGLQPRLARVDARRRDERRLADARRAIHHDRAALTPGHRLGGRPDHVELCTPFEELGRLAVRIDFHPGSAGRVPPGGVRRVRPIMRVARRRGKAALRSVKA
jgi:hypothetical protein